MPETQDYRLPAIVSGRLLEIPDYQRPYAWGQKQLQDLWEDLDLLGPDVAHYAGTLVLRDVPTGSGSVRTSMDDDGDTLRHCEVVDGQQRLTSCFVVLDRIRRRLEKLDEAGQEGAGNPARNLRSRYGMVSVNNVAVPKLRLGKELNGYWVSVILGDQTFAGPPLIAGQRRLKEAAEFFDAKLDGLEVEAPARVQVGRLLELQRRVTDGLRFLVYEVRSAADVGVIFETLNDRGRPLTELEKTKNYLLYLARGIQDGRAEALADVINDAWSSIFANLAKGPPEMDDDLLRVHWLTTQNPEQSRWAGVGSVKERFDRSHYVSGRTRLVPEDDDQGQEAAWDDLFSAVGDYVDSLRRSSFFFVEMFDPNAEFEAFASDSDREGARRRSAALVRSGRIAPYRPLLLACRLRHPADGALYTSLVDLFERYTARVFVICRLRSNTGERRLRRLAFDLFEGRDPDDVLLDIRSNIWEYAPDGSVRDRLSSTSENWYQRTGHKYLLYEYELSLVAPGEELPQFASFTGAGREQRTTEHILPQHPKDSAACWWDHFTTEEHAELCHTLGNLALTLDNSSYSNKCFDQKRGKHLEPGEEPTRCYAQGKLHQERLLAKYRDWTPETIKSRQMELAEWALGRWAVEPPPWHAEPEEGVLETEGTDEDAAVVQGAWG